MNFGFSLIGSMAWFLIWREPTLPWGRRGGGVARAAKRHEQRDVSDDIPPDVLEDNLHPTSSQLPDGRRSVDLGLILSVLVRRGRQVPPVPTPCCLGLRWPCLAPSRPCAAARLARRRRRGARRRTRVSVGLADACCLGWVPRAGFGLGCSCSPGWIAPARRLRCAGRVRCPRWTAEPARTRTTDSMSWSAVGITRK